MKKLLVVGFVAMIGFGGAIAEEKDDKDEGPKPVWETDKKQKERKKEGKFSTCTPDPFLLCSHPRPKKKGHKQDCWDEVC